MKLINKSAFENRFSRIKLLDCTLRDGGYINEWNFGYNNIKGIVSKLEQTGIEAIELGFIKGDEYNPDVTLFPDIASFKNIIEKKKDNVQYFGMLDMSNPVPLERITPNDGSSIDGIRVIFKKDKLQLAYEYCNAIKKLGYILFVNFVNTDQYSDKEFIEGLELFNKLDPDGVTIVDTFGMIKRKDFLRLVSLADNNLDPKIMLCYHAHNNLQQAFGNAENLVELNIKRILYIDACVFGMGRGAGNLNLELFAGFMNENFETDYQISPMLEIMDEYLSLFYHTKFWGYSLPLYLSASYGCHPNYAIYIAEKNTLSEKAFNELLKSISNEDKIIFSKDKAEKYYHSYLENYIDDKSTLEMLKNDLANKKVVLIAPGNSINKYKSKIIKESENSVVITINFYEKDFCPDYVFCSNLKRYEKLTAIPNDTKLITTSNIKLEKGRESYRINFSSYLSSNENISDNSGLMALKFLATLGVKGVRIAGYDGFISGNGSNFYKHDMESNPLIETHKKNTLVAEELNNIRRHLNFSFITPTVYKVD